MDESDIWKNDLMMAVSFPEGKKVLFLPELSTAIFLRKKSNVGKKGKRWALKIVRMTPPKFFPYPTTLFRQLSLSLFVSSA